MVEKSARRKRVNPTDQNQNLMAKCTNALDRRRLVTHLRCTSQYTWKIWIKDGDYLRKKRINDILFELQFEEFGPPGRAMHFNQHFAHSPSIHSMHNVLVKLSSSYENRVPKLQQPQPQHMSRCCKNFKALYLVFLILFLFNSFMTEAVII